MNPPSDLFASIIANNRERERLTLAPCACSSDAGVRHFPERESIPDQHNFRPAFFHDTDTIIHSRTYARYIDKTQVFSMFENDHITHRVLHVQFVSKIARVIGRALRLNEDLIEAIALGHDLGHAPFGHEGEYILNDLCQAHHIGFFCHNAQSVRAMTEIENAGQGLNLTLQVLDGILAHNGEMLNREYIPHYDKTWAQFESDYQACFTQAGHSRHITPKTLEGCVMRISDIIAYIGRDIEDAIELKLLHRDQLPPLATRILGNRNSQIIDTLVTDLIQNSSGLDHLAFSENVFQALRELLDFNRRNIYQNPRIKGEMHKVRFMFNQLFECYLNDLRADNKDSALFTFFLRDSMAEYRVRNKPERMVIDFLAGMTDRFLVDQFRSLFLPRSMGYQAPE